MYRTTIQNAELPTLAFLKRASSILPQFLIYLVLIMAALSTMPGQAKAAVQVRPFFLYDLSTFTGKVPLSYARVTVDEKRNEVYVADPASHSIRIFNKQGLQVYSFGEDDTRFGHMEDMVVLDDGDIIVLNSGQFFLCNYRGKILKILKLTGLPKSLAAFRPGRTILRNGQIYLAQYKTMQIVVTDTHLKFIRQIDIPAMMKLSPAQVDKIGMGGFNVAEDGTILFTNPNQAHAYRLPPGSKELQQFGETGDAPGKFGVVQGIAPGPDGLIYIADVLKSCIIVFDKNLEFVTEFGGRSGRPGGTWSPVNLASTSDCRLYVTQRSHYGISVFRVCEQSE